MEYNTVVSSNIKAVGYDDETFTLEVAFTNGTTYRYLSVPRSIFDGLLQADSPGRYFNAEIKGGNFPYFKLDPS